MVFSEKDVHCLSAGAHILGGGGGGQKSRGLKTAEDALQIGTVRMVDAADLCDGDILVTVMREKKGWPQRNDIRHK